MNLKHFPYYLNNLLPPSQQAQVDFLVGLPTPDSKTAHLTNILPWKHERIQLR